MVRKHTGVLEGCPSRRDVLRGLAVQGLPQGGEGSSPDGFFAQIVQA